MNRDRATSAIVGLLAIGSQLVPLLLSSAGCSAGPSYPAGPVAVAVPASFDYTTDPQAYAVYVGETVPFSAQINDDATNNLTFSGSCSLNGGGGAFTLAMPCPSLGNNDGGTGASIGSPPAAANIQVVFTPTAYVIYNATVTIQTNAVNDGGLLTIPIHALGVNPDAGIPADAGVLGDAGLYDDGG